MAGKNQVTLTLAGDSTQLESAFSKVGESAKTMGTDVGSASSKIREGGDNAKAGFDRAGEAADGGESKAQGFSDTLTGTKDLMDATGEIAKGNYFEGFVMAGQGAADLAGGLASTVIPAVKALATGFIGQAATAVRATAANATHRVVTLTTAAATRVMTVAQRGLNLAMRANPIGLVITAIILLVGAIVLAYKRSATFRSIVQGAMRGVQTAFGWVITKGGELMGWFQRLPGKIGGFFGGLASTIKRPFTSAFQGIKDFWNSTVGGKGFDVPGWVPGVGGRSFRIPFFHQGGIMPGAPGTEGLALLQAGERITPAGRSGVESSTPQSVEVRVFIGDRELTDIVRTEVSTGNRRTKRALTAGALRGAPA